MSKRKSGILITALVLLGGGLWGQNSGTDGTRTTSTISQADAISRALAITGFECGKSLSPSATLASSEDVEVSYRLPYRSDLVRNRQLWEVSIPGVVLRIDADSSRKYPQLQTESEPLDFIAYVDAASGALIAAKASYVSPIGQLHSDPWDSLLIDCLDTLCGVLRFPDAAPSKTLNEVLAAVVSSQPVRAEEIEAYCVTWIASDCPDGRRPSWIKAENPGGRELPWLLESGEPFWCLLIKHMDATVISGTDGPALNATERIVDCLYIGADGHLAFSVCTTSERDKQFR